VREVLAQQSDVEHGAGTGRCRCVKYGEAEL